MSLEDFKNRYPVGPAVKDAVRREQVGYGSHCSLIYVLADDLARDAGSGLRELTRKTNSSGIALRPTRAELLRFYTPEEMESIVQHHSAVIFGASVKCILNAMTFDHFNQADFASYMVEPLRGTDFGKPEIDKDGGKEAITYERCRQMLALAAKDKTLTSFFNEGFSIVPQKLRKYWMEYRQIDVIRGWILPIFKARAQFLTE